MATVAMERGYARRPEPPRRPRTVPSMQELGTFLRRLSRHEQSRRACLLMLGLGVKPGLAWQARLVNDQPWMAIGPDGYRGGARRQPIPTCVHQEVLSWREGTTPQITQSAFRKRFDEVRRDVGLMHLVPSSMRDFMVMSLYRMGDEGAPRAVNRTMLMQWLGFVGPRVPDHVDDLNGHQAIRCSEMADLVIRELDEASSHALIRHRA